MKRFLADAFLFIGALFLPWWVTLPVGFLFFFLFEPFYEVLLLAFFLDALYGVPTPRFGGFQFMLSTATLLLYFAARFIKGRMMVGGFSLR
ncbi:MAG: hypothetical protein Greene041679_142 [Parcubacteria group bacterium Greene0416_79]|nr:MAG: hypothetical protein Greene041679_142 [Parcubacteria group bacterium Greene0416_79]